jgi:two-component system response regulator
MDPRPILLVEDNPDDVDLTLRALRKNDIRNEVVVARDGREALERLFGDRGPSGDPDVRRPSVVLLDLKLPHVDGFEVLKQMRSNESTRLIPVVILTSSKEELDLLNGYRLGANSYVRKPVDYDQFLMTVQELGQYWLALNEPVLEKEEA